MDRWELAKKCARIEQAGGSVREYLKGLGFISPWGTWFRLQREELGRKENHITDGKGGTEMRKITLADKKKAVEIAISGGNPLPYLKECGSKNPSAAWYAIKQTLKETDPETYALLPDLRKKDEPKEEETMNEILMDAEPEIMPVDNQGEPVKIPQEPVREEQPEAKPLNYAGFDVTGIRAEYGEFKLSCNGYLFFGANDHDELEMPVEVWRKFAADLPLVMGILGIKA